MRTPIKLKFGTLEGVITTNLITNFGENPINNYGVVTNCLHKIKSILRVNHFEKSIENWPIVRVAFAGVLFSG